MKNRPQGIVHRWWWRQQFTPGFPGLLINPFYFARRGLADSMQEFFPRLTGAVLDVGCGRKPYRHLVPARDYVGLDLDTPELRELGAADLFYGGGRMPVEDERFEGVLCSQVLEHIFSPTDFLGEIRRVLRPNGWLLLTTPFAWDEHSQPDDFARYSSFGLRHVLEKAGFEVVAQRKTCADGRVLVQLAAGYLYKKLNSRHRWLNRCGQMCVIAPFNMVGGALVWCLPANPDLYLDNVVLARKRAEPGQPPGAEADKP
jgi:SAM-dependent methyltransferase